MPDALAIVRLWYGVVCTLGFAYYGYEPTNDVIRAPSSAPKWLVWAAWRGRRFSRVALLITGALLALHPTLASASMGARACFALCLAACDLWLGAFIYNHAGYVLLYTSMAMVLPAGPSRSTILRLIFMQQLGSSGIMKLRIAGFAGFCHPDSMERWLSFSLNSKVGKGEEFYSNPHRMVDNPSLMSDTLVRAILARPWARLLLQGGGLLMELAVLPLGLFCRGRLQRWALFAVGASFHLFTVPLMGIIFPHSIPCYALALLPDDADDLASLAEPGAPLIVALLMCAATALGAENWPHNCMAMFPYTAKQSDRLRSLRGRFTLGFASDSRSGTHTDAASDAARCVSTICVAACPVSYNPGFVRAVTGLSRWRFFLFPTDQPLDDIHDIHARLRAWVASTKPYICARTCRSFDEVYMRHVGVVGEAGMHRPADAHPPGT